LTSNRENFYFHEPQPKTALIPSFNKLLLNLSFQTLIHPENPSALRTNPWTPGGESCLVVGHLRFLNNYFTIADAFEVCLQEFMERILRRNTELDEL
jgi:hypothetical protein